MVPENGNGNRSLAAAVAQFLEETELTKKPKTLAAYTTALNYFTESCRKFYMLFWVVNLDGKKMESETYKLMAVVGAPGLLASGIPIVPGHLTC